MHDLAVVFPGQGSQSVGMLAELGSKYPIIRQVFNSVSEQLSYDLWQLVQEGPEARLNQTEFTQVAVLTADIAIYSLLKEETGIEPGFMAGHSLGEYAALVAAEALSLQEAVSLVAKRGELMQKAVPLGEGAMAAVIGLDLDVLQRICDAVSTEFAVVSMANFNALGQVVIAGHTQAVQEAIEQADRSGARLAKMIPVSVPCHCALLKGAAIEFATYLDQVAFKSPKIPVVSNVDLSIHRMPEDIRLRLQEHLYRPVRWVETIQYFKNKGVDTVLECGPGKVLTALVKRIDSTLTTRFVNDGPSFLSLIKEKISE